MHKVRTKYILRMSLFIVLTIGVMILMYNLLVEDFYISGNEKKMNKLFESIQKKDLENLTDKDVTEFDEFAEGGFSLIIANDKEAVYNSIKSKSADYNLKHYVWGRISAYTEDAMAQLSESGDSINLRGKIKKDGDIYYVYINIRLKTLQKSISFMSNFLVMEMFIILIIGIPFSIYISNRTVKPVEQIFDMTEKMKNNEYISKDEYEFSNDEIGAMAIRIAEMYNEMGRNVNELNNYNYLLQSQNQSFVEFDKRRKEFISMATHELKTPLAIISSQMEMLNLDNEEIMSEYYDSIMEEIQKMSKVIRDMLNASFEDNMMRDVSFEKTNLSEFIKNLKNKYKTWLDTKNIASRFDIEDDLYINMNSEQIEQALNNYIINAYEHTQKDGMVIISLSKRGNMAVISVYNDGDNISAKDIDNIWNSFYRQDKDKNSSNVGLGLYIVKDIVNSHDGKCFVVNKPYGVEFVMEYKLV